MPEHATWLVEAGVREAVYGLSWFYECLGEWEVVLLVRRLPSVRVRVIKS